MKCTYAIEVDNAKPCFADITVRLYKPNAHSHDGYHSLAKAGRKKKFMTNSCHNIYSHWLVNTQLILQ